MLTIQDFGLNLHITKHVNQCFNVNQYFNVYKCNVNQYFSSMRFNRITYLASQRKICAYNIKIEFIASNQEESIYYTV